MKARKSAKYEAILKSDIKHFKRHEMVGYIWGLFSPPRKSNCNSLNGMLLSCI